MSSLNFEIRETVAAIPFVDAAVHTPVGPVGPFRVTMGRLIAEAGTATSAAWIKAIDYTWNGEPWDSYITHPMERSGRNTQQTSIYIPIGRTA